LVSEPITTCWGYRVHEDAVALATSPTGSTSAPIVLEKDRTPIRRRALRAATGERWSAAASLAARSLQGSGDVERDCLDGTSGRARTAHGGRFSSRCRAQVSVMDRSRQLCRPAPGLSTDCRSRPTAARTTGSIAIGRTPAASFDRPVGGRRHAEQVHTDTRSTTRTENTSHERF